MRTLILSVFITVIQTISFAQTEVVYTDNESKDNMTVIDFFTVNCNEKIWDIKWKALSEINNCSYAIEYSLDQVNWVLYKEFDGTAQTSGVYVYSTFMKRSSDSVHYFRLRYDVTSTQTFYKNPVANICPDYIPESTTTFVVEYDNSSIQLSCNSNNNLPSKVAVYSVLGQQLYQTETIVNSSKGKVSIPYQLKNNEVVIVKITNGNNVFSKKIYIP